MKINFYLKYLEFHSITVKCSDNDLVSEVIKKFIKKTNIINVNLTYKKGSCSDLNQKENIKEALYRDYDKYYKYDYISVFYPSNYIEKINLKNEKIYKRLKLIDDEINNKIFKISLNETKTIYICKDKKTEFVSSLKRKLSNLSYVAEEFFSKLFDKNDKLSKIKDYYKENTFNDNNELKKFFLTKKK